VANAKNETEKTLEGKIILVIEDDKLLKTGLQEAFEGQGCSKIVLKECIENAFKEISKQGKDYDLIMLDIMLPETEKQLNRLRELEQELDEVRGVLRQEDEMDPDNNSLRDEIEKAYNKRATILREKDTLVNRRGGIELLEKLNDKGLLGNQLPILVLTAVGNKEDVYDGMKLLSESGDWLVKPVNVQTLINKAQELINKKKE
jgi:DNA-binding response OmpR family regulator